MVHDVQFPEVTVIVSVVVSVHDGWIAATYSPIMSVYRCIYRQYVCNVCIYICICISAVG